MLKVFVFLAIAAAASPSMAASSVSNPSTVSLALHDVGLEIDEALWEDFERRRLEIGTAIVTHVSGGSGAATGVATDIWYVRDGMGRGVRASRLAQWLGDDDLLNEIASRKRTRRMIGLGVAGAGAAMTAGGVYWFIHRLQNIDALSSDSSFGWILGTSALASFGVSFFILGLPIALSPGDTENLSTYRPRGQAERMVHRYNRNLAEELGIDIDRRQDKRPSPTQVRLTPGGVAVAGTF